MQEVLLAEAERAGAQVRRGVTVEALEPRGDSPGTVGANHATLTARSQTTQQPTEKIAARLVVGVDGRGSAVRRWGAFDVEKSPLAFQFAGVQLTGVRWREDLAAFIFNPELGMVVGMVPQTRAAGDPIWDIPTATVPLVA
jgi:2-polyprenyl-6-methoxyphenol hydroxylase-like FAD-dependent oxidoreductase